MDARVRSKHGKSHLLCEDSDIGSSCLDFDDHSESDDDIGSYIVACDDDRSQDSEPEDKNLIPMMDLLLVDFEQCTRQWNTRVDGRVIKPGSSSKSGVTSIRRQDDPNASSPHICKATSGTDNLKLDRPDPTNLRPHIKITKGESVAICRVFSVAYLP